MSSNLTATGRIKIRTKQLHGFFNGQRIKSIDSITGKRTEITPVDPTGNYRVNAKSSSYPDQVNNNGQPVNSLIIY